MGTVNQVTKEQFEANIGNYKTIYGSYEKYLAAQAALLKTESIHTFAKKNTSFNTSNPIAEAFYQQRMEAYDKHNAKSEELITNYKQLEAVYKALLNQQSSINNSLMSKYQVSNKSDLVNTMSANNSLVDQGLYNSTSKSVNEAYANYISALQTANYQTHDIV